MQLNARVGDWLHQKGWSMGTACPRRSNSPYPTGKQATGPGGKTLDATKIRTSPHSIKIGSVGLFQCPRLVPPTAIFQQTDDLRTTNITPTYLENTWNVFPKHPKTYTSWEVSRQHPTSLHLAALILRGTKKIAIAKKDYFLYLRGIVCGHF